MSDIAISAHNLGKAYRIVRSVTRYRTLQEDILHLLRSPFSAFRRTPKQEIFWALRDAGFEIKHGEVVGIIGRNGAGKSTLLKVLSRITLPTTGYADVYGRVGSLLEVGTGFHPELTGRENIFLNGAILGMTRRDIQRQFDEIVAFAEVEQFLDTPVKRYSSGMYMRLAFAVAAHLEPEILVIDEVLAVGDVKFQSKSMGKMGDVARSGRTVLFVSHNMAAVEYLCTRGIVLDQGQVVFDGSQKEAIQRYTALNASQINLHERQDRTGSGEVRLTAIELRALDNSRIDNVACGQDFNIHFHYQAQPGVRSGPYLYVSIVVKTELDQPVFVHHNRLTRDEFNNLPQTGAFVCQIRHLPLSPSSYRISYEVRYHNDVLDAMNHAANLNVIEGDFYGSGEVPPSHLGIMLVDARWYLEQSDPVVQPS